VPRHASTVRLLAGVLVALGGTQAFAEPLTLQVVDAWAGISQVTAEPFLVIRLPRDSGNVFGKFTTERFSG
jgi:hypothetical protein